MTILFKQTPCHVHSLHLTHSFLASVLGTSLLLFTLVYNRDKLIEMQASHFQISNPYKAPKTQALYHSCGRLISYATAPACSPHAQRPSAHVKGGKWVAPHLGNWLFTFTLFQYQRKSWEYAKDIPLDSSAGYPKPHKGPSLIMGFQDSSSDLGQVTWLVTAAPWGTATCHYRKTQFFSIT